MADESLDYAERWLLDSLHVLRPSAVSYQTSVDMTHGLEELEQLRRAGTTATATHLLVHAAARALAANPSLHQLILGSRRHRPARVDIGVSITGETFLAPVLVLEGADRKSVAELAAETAQRVPEVQHEERERLRTLRRWGWVLPFGFLRRAVMRHLFARGDFRQKTAGTFQVSTVPVESAATSVFVASGLLVGGQVKSRVVAIDGHPVVRPTMILTLSGDHSVWDGRAAARFLAAVKSALETPIPELVVSSAAALRSEF
jgi:pyruvate/2-oxoglutarate dehydrogenase complex dihydrolipoamide acyltransferase (E2) component